jgi:acetolactate synthase-1/2/3 large subunit
MVTAGPGSTNAITGLAGAWLDSTPVLFLSGQVKTADLKGDLGVRMLGSQEIDIVSIVRSITKYAVTVTVPSTIRYHLEKALFLSKVGRPGPVWLDMPMDVQGAMVDEDSMVGFSPDERTDTAPEQLRIWVRRTLDLMEQASRPVVLVGNGVRVAGAESAFLKLVERLRAPVLASWLGLDLLEDDHPLHAGKPGSIAARGANFTLQNIDFLLVLGSRLDMAMTGYAHEKFARGANKTIVDIDEAEINKLNMRVDVKAVSDAKVFSNEMLRQLEERRLPDYSEWVARTQAWKSKYPLGAPQSDGKSTGLSAYDFSSALSEAIPCDALIVPGSSGFAVEIFLLMLKTKAGQRCFHNRGTGAMGLSIPAALGACLGADRKLTVTLDGDGGFQLNIQELATVAGQDLPIKFFVINNNGYASIRSSQNGYFPGNLVGCDPASGLKLPDICSVARAYGLPAMRIEQGDDVAAKIQEAIRQPGPVVCEVVVMPDEPRVPRLASSRRPDGSMVSRPLEDLYPFLSREELQENMIIPVLDECLET